MNNHMAVRSVALGLSGAVIALGLLDGDSLAKPPLQLAEGGVRVEPLAIAPARLENGKFVFGEWQEYVPVQTRGAKGYYYIFDSFGGYIFDDLSPSGYVNHAHAGRGAAPSDERAPWDFGCGMGSSRWTFGPTYNSPLIVEDIQSLAQGSRGGSPIDGVDVAWRWGGGECIVTVLVSDESALCEDGDPLAHGYDAGVALDFGDIEPTPEMRYIYANVSGIWSQTGVFLPIPSAGGSYLARLSHSDGKPASEPGTSFALWGTGDAHAELFRAGTQASPAWDDDRPPDGHLTGNECSEYDYLCPTPMGKCVGFLSLRCPADVNWDGFVNGDDYDLFASWFDQGLWPAADVDGDSLVTPNDVETFVSWFLAGC